MVDRGDEHRLHELPDRRTRKLAAQDQVHRLAERDPAHELVDPVPADADLVGLDRGDRRGPFLLGHRHPSKTFATAAGRASNASTTVAPASRNAATLPS